MGFKTNLIISAVFLGLLAFVYFHEIKGGEDRRLEAERAKQLVDFADHEARSLLIERGDSSTVVEKLPDRWVLQEPVQTDADQSAVERYLRTLRETEVERIIEDSAAVSGDPELLAQYGLDHPRLRVLLELVEGPGDTVLLGQDNPIERFTYARRSGDNPEVFTVRAWRFDNLDKGLDDLRDRRVLAFEKQDVRQIRLMRSARDDTVRLVRDSGGEWMLESPVAAPADQSSVNGMLDRLHDGKAEEFVAEQPDEEAWREYGLTADLARLQVSLLLGDELAEKRLVVGLQPQEGDHYARDPSRAPVVLIDSSLVHKLEEPVSELRDKRPLRLDRDSVRRLELVLRGEKPLVAARDTAATWSILEPEPRTAKSWRLNSLLTDIDGIEVKEFIADGENLDLDPYGLAEPAIAVTIDFAEEPSLEVRLGQELDGSVYLTRWGSSAVYLVDAGIVEMLSLELADVAQPPASAPGDTVVAGG